MAWFDIFLFGGIHQELTEIRAAIADLDRKGDVNMATIQEAFANLQKEVGETKTEVAETGEAVGRAITKIDELKAVIAGGGVVTPEALDAMAADLNSAQASLDGAQASLDAASTTATPPVP